MDDLPRITFMAKLPRRRMGCSITITSGRIWSPALRLWFVWTECAVWDSPRPWHLNDLPAAVRDQVMARQPESTETA